MAYESERDEWREARRHNNTDCYRHNYVTNRSGGGTCTGCGATLEAAEL